VSALSFCVFIAKNSLSYRGSFGAHTWILVVVYQGIPERRDRPGISTISFVAKRLLSVNPPRLQNTKLVKDRKWFREEAYKKYAK
jgi:hypothetical protein